MPDANGNPVIGDSYNAVVTTTANQATCSAAKAVADQADLAADAAKDAADAKFSTDLKAVGGSMFNIDANGVVVVLQSDSSTLGFHPFNPVSVSTPLPVAPAPVPAPTPTPDPTPAPAPSPEPTPAPPAN